MTLLQLRYVIACVENGTIAKAAQAMYTSTSNLSQSIRGLEREVGFEIFHRSNNGITLTEKGTVFLEHAMKIQLEIDNIAKLKEAETVNRFSCICMHLPYCYMAFESLCRHYEENDNYLLSIDVEFLPKCIEAVQMHLSEIAVISMPEVIASIECQRIKDQGLSIKMIAEQHLNINLRADHPALADYTEGQSLELSRLHDYPYVSYHSSIDDVIHPLDFSHPSYCPTEAFNSRKQVTVNNVDWKARLIGNTNAYGIGTTGPEKWAEQYNWECIPVEGAKSFLYYVYSDQYELSEPAHYFINYLLKIIEKNPT